jgi:hypothetical protein
MAVYVREGEVTKVNVLGAEWEIIDSNPVVHPMLEKCDGYTDYTVQKIIVHPVTSDRADVEIVAPEVSDKRVRRHELIHAFLYESGLADDAGWPGSETAVDWIARQFPKLLKAFQDAGAI